MTALADRIDLCIVGAGPAGLAAAVEARTHGLSVVLLDEQATPGGQIYRAVETAPARRAELLGDDYRRGAELVSAFRASGARYLSGASVWQVEPDGQVAFTQNGRVGFLAPSRVILATGAQERPVPLPGWTLPGVMTAGAGQITLKSAGLLPQGKVLLAGSGPLLWLLAWQYLQAGADIAAVVETVPWRNRWRALSRMPQALGAPHVLVKGLRLLAAVRHAGVPLIRNAEALRVRGETRAEGVAYRAGGSWHEIAADLVLLHQGVVPNVQLTQALGCTHDWDASQLCWRPRLDPWGNSDQPGIAVAGDGGGIDGALAAEQSGRLAALEAAFRLGRIDAAARDRATGVPRAILRRERRARPFLERLYRPPAIFRRPEDDTLVCRCEEVTAGALRAAAALGCQGPNQAKAYTRCGMGPCQGRLCGLTVSEVLAESLGRPVAAVGHYQVRNPVKPVTLGALAAAEIPSAVDAETPLQGGDNR